VAFLGAVFESDIIVLIATSCVVIIIVVQAYRNYKRRPHYKYDPNTQSNDPV
jgi:hypothetical protein